MLYRLNGINFIDLLKLRWDNIQGNRFVFYRHKTLKTRRNNIRPIEVVINSKVQKLLAIQLAKSKDKIKTAVNKSLSQDETIDLNNEPDKARKILKDITKVVTDAVSGKSTSTTADSAKKKVDAAKEKVKTEKE